MDAETLTEPERRVALLDWLARGRDVRIAAELCGEKHDWAKDIAKAAGHPDRDQIRQALAVAKAELHPPRQPLKPDSVAPPRPVPRPAVPVEHAPGCDCCTCDLERISVDDMTVEQIVELIGTEDGGDADLPEHTEDMDVDDGLNPPFHHGPEHVIAAGAGGEEPARVVYEPEAFEAALALANAGTAAEIRALEAAADVVNNCAHAPRLVLEGRLWHAVCPACGTTWHRTLCTATGCGAYVSAEYVARTGSTRHDWHPKEQS